MWQQKSVIALSLNPFPDLITQSWVIRKITLIKQNMSLMKMGSLMKASTFEKISCSCDDTERGHGAARGVGTSDRLRFHEYDKYIY